MTSKQTKMSKTSRNCAKKKNRETGFRWGFRREDQKRSAYCVTAGTKALEGDGVSCRRGSVLPARMEENEGHRLQPFVIVSNLGSHACKPMADEHKLTSMSSWQKDSDANYSKVMRFGAFFASVLYFRDRFRDWKSFQDLDQSASVSLLTRWTSANFR